MTKESDRFVKSEMPDALSGWLANGLATNRDAAHHAAIRDVMMPAFRPDAIRGYCHMFTDVADALARVLLESEGAPLSERARRAGGRAGGLFDAVRACFAACCFACLFLATAVSVRGCSLLTADHPKHRPTQHKPTQHTNTTPKRQNPVKTS